MNRKLVALLFLALPLAAQTVVFSPYDKVAGATAWNVTACLTPGTPGTVLAGGRLYQMLAVRGANPLPYSVAFERLHEKPKKSTAARVVKYIGWSAVGTGFLMQVDVIKRNEKIEEGLQIGGAFLSVLIPLAQKEVPGPGAIEQQLIGPFLQISAGDCASGVILGGLGSAFQVTL